MGEQPRTEWRKIYWCHFCKIAMFFCILESMKTLFAIISVYLMAWVPLTMPSHWLISLARNLILLNTRYLRCIAIQRWIAHFVPGVVKKQTLQNRTRCTWESRHIFKNFSKGYQILVALHIDKIYCGKGPGKSVVVEPPPPLVAIPLNVLLYDCR